VGIPPLHVTRFSAALSGRIGWKFKPRQSLGYAFMALQAADLPNVAC
jgi:hypothetical protein